MGGVIRVGLVLALAASGASAQTMYRCGSVYQDRPCAAGQKGKAVGSTGTGATTPSGSGNAQCAQRGRDALKIVWLREGGATQERALQEAGSAEQRRLVQDVWRRGGAGSTVQAAVEADCNVEMQKREEAAALSAEAARLRREAGLAPEAPPAASSARQYVGDPKAGERTPQVQASAEAERKKAACARLDSRMNNLRERERAGGGQATLDRLNEERRRLRDEIGKAGC